MPTIFIPNSKGYARNFVHFSRINNVFYFLIIRFRLNFYLHSCNNFPRSLIFYIFSPREKWLAPKNFIFDFIFLFFFLEKLSIEFRGKKKEEEFPPRNRYVAQEIVIARRSHKSFRCFLFPRPLVEGVVNLAKSPIIQNHSKISWTK